MTHPTTEPNIRERLARKASEASFETLDVLEATFVVDAILAELQEPSEGMLQAIMIRQASVRGDRLVLTDEQRDEVDMIVADYKAMIRHIRDGG